MNWERVIDRNRDALLRIVAALFAMAGIAGGEMAATLPRHLHNHVLRILRPAESAVRRLIIIVARACCGGETAPARHHNIHHNRHYANCHRTDRRSFRHRPTQAFRLPPAEAPRPVLPAHHLHRPHRADADPRRLVSLARWRARRDLNRTGRFHPMRPGRPPGHRKRPVHEVDDVLRECHSLAHYAQRLDTS